jgi:preprotein translocase subunit SecE
MLRLNVMKKIIDFLTEVKVELSKVVWPTPNLTIKLTVIVIIVTVSVGFFIGGVDYLLTKLLEVILKK